MPGMYNQSGGWNPGQFMSSMFDNWQTNQMNNWQQQNQQAQNQYQSDLDYWNQMNDYYQQNQAYEQWASGADRMAPIRPTQAPIKPIWGTPPEYGNIDFGSLFGGFGGGGGYGNSQMPTWNGSMPGAFDGKSYQSGTPWVNPGIDTANMVDPSAVIASAQPGIMENMNKAFADAGNRFGSSGMVGTPYAGALGEASRGAANDIANITNQYQFQAAQSAAEREQQRALAEYGADYNAWAQQGDWAHQGQLADMGQNFNAWAQMGDWQNQNNMGQNAFNQQNWQTQGNWDQQNYWNQQDQNQNMMMQYLPMMMQMMGGGMY